jgi:hypothetical protein
MSGLVEFLLARIAEDEAAVSRVADASPSWARRMRAECEAKRGIVSMHAGAVAACCWTHDPNTTHDELEAEAGRPCKTLRFLALPCADHPDHRSEWRP